MTTAFDINHDGYLDINEQLLREVQEIGRIITDLNVALKHIPQAIWGGPEPIWADEQRIWNGQYNDMHQNINASALSSCDIHEIFKDGDHQGTRIMLG